MEVTVTDGNGNGSDRISLEVPNSAPTVTISTQPRKVQAGDALTISSSASDVDPGDASALIYRWSHGIPNGNRTSWIAPSSPDEYEIEVEVEDPEGLTGSDSVIMTVNDPPTVSLTASSYTVDAGETVTITADISDSDDSISLLTRTWGRSGGLWVGGDSLVSNSAYEREWEAPNSKGDYRLRLRVSDGIQMGEDELVVTVRNSDPVVTISPVAVDIQQGGTQVFNARATDLDNDVITFSWDENSISGTLSSASGSTVRYTAPSTSGIEILEVTADDGDGGVDTAEATIDVLEEDTEPSPTISLSASSSSLDPGETIDIILTITSYDTFRATADRGSLRLTSNGTEVKSYRYTAPSQSRGEITIEAEAENTTLLETVEDSLTLEINNVGPVAGSITGVPSSIRVDNTFTASMSATDANGDSLDFSWFETGLSEEGSATQQGNTSRQTFRAPEGVSESTNSATVSCEVDDGILDDISFRDVTIVPGIPGRPSLDEHIVTASSFAIEWQEPDDGGADIERYNITVRLGSSIGSLVINTTTKITAYTASDLSANTRYYFSVSASNYDATGGVSSRLITTGEDIAPTNIPPSLDRVGNRIILIDPGDEATCTVMYDDLDGDDVTLTWGTSTDTGSWGIGDVGGGSSGSGSVVFTSVNTETGVAVAAVFATDEHGLQSNTIDFAVIVGS